MLKPGPAFFLMQAWSISPPQLSEQEHLEIWNPGRKGPWVLSVQLVELLNWVLPKSPSVPPNHGPPKLITVLTQ